MEAAKHARTLWDEMGGTKDAWNFVTSSKLPPAGRTDLTHLPVRPVNQFAAWKSVQEPLREMTLVDFSGKAWTLADFRGKTTFVAVWATWCSPCREELPSLQKLHELARNQKDVQVVTLNVDEDPGLVEPFLKSNGLTFPVLTSAGGYVAKVTERLDIPQNWVVDRTGTVREESAGFDPGTVDWPTEMLRKLIALPR